MLHARAAHAESFGTGLLIFVLELKPDYWFPDDK